MINFYKLHKQCTSLHNYKKYSPALHKLVRYGTNVLCYLDYFHDIKHIMMRDSYWGYWYAHNGMGKRWLEAEPYIMMVRYNAACYSQYVIKGRWLEAEHLFETPFWANWYAIDVIKGRWLESEYIIKTDEKIWKDYCLKFGVEND